MHKAYEVPKGLMGLVDARTTYFIDSEGVILYVPIYLPSPLTLFLLLPSPRSLAYGSLGGNLGTSMIPLLTGTRTRT